ncbi:hypothetical protein SESBI_50873 [Sesbania bispinosa]|nr:hypothetical protein SESBI_50873 [Sesbania bispinosa]
MLTTLVDTQSNANTTASGRGLRVDATAPPTNNSRLKYLVCQKPLVVMASGVPATVSVLGASVITSAAGVSAAKGCAPLIPPRPQNASPGSSPGQPSCQELLEFIRRQDVMLSEYPQRLTRLEYENIRLSAQV